MLICKWLICFLLLTSFRWRRLRKEHWKMNRELCAFLTKCFTKRYSFTRTNNLTFTWIGVQLKRQFAYINMHHMELTFTNFQRVNYYYNEDRINKSHCVALRGKMIASICTTYRMFVCSFPMQGDKKYYPTTKIYTKDSFHFFEIWISFILNLFRQIFK